MSTRARKWTWAGFLTVATLVLGVAGYLFTAAQEAMSRSAAFGRVAERFEGVQRRVETIESRQTEHDRLMHAIDAKLGVIEERTRWLQSLRDGKNP